ncbi:probable 28S ribosomal protein S23, mitochondrial [Mya arenaria]|uniref:probable 28S ribosomal protein S23, mitochondrial n=1 Tax=Mya arenaria TaxID=6604 RepID=UPI0022DF4E1F|nr:probable 28S ribosomal protein S23, mitochondrial [Mya arenaria]
MAGSRVHKHSSIFKRVDGLLKSEALEWKNRPLWYDVMKKFPPQVEPRMDRPVPNVHVKKILYPEDYVRAKLLDVYESTDVINLRLKRRDIKTKPQLFVDEYLKRQRPGVSVEEIFQEIEEKFRSEGKRLLRKKNPVIIKSVNIEEEAKDGFDVKKLDDMS